MERFTAQFGNTTLSQNRVYTWVKEFNDGRKSIKNIDVGGQLLQSLLNVIAASLLKKISSTIIGISWFIEYSCNCRNVQSIITGYLQKN